MAVSFIGGGSRSAQRKPLQSMINTIFCIILVYKLHYDIRPRFLSSLHTGEFVFATKQLILPLNYILRCTCMEENGF